MSFGFPSIIINGDISFRTLLASVPKIYKKIAIFFEWDEKILFERNKNRKTSRENKKLKKETIEDFIKSFQPINSEEGFDKTITIPIK